MQFVTLFFALTLCIPSAAAITGGTNPTLRIGLAYGSGALLSANLENNTGYGSGYRLGYFDGNYDFVQLGYTVQTQLTMLKTQNTYLSGTKYSGTAPSTSFSVIGCYYIQLANPYSGFDAAQAAAGGIANAYPTWVNGTFYVRVGSYATSAAATSALQSLGMSGASVVEGSPYAVSVTKTGTASILFQFDGGSSCSLGILPGLDDSTENRTWFKGFKYYGGFQYQRLGGGDLTVVNFVPLETYLKGVVPYEMSGSWPAEALKAQAVCARTYAMMNLNKHASYGFDLCNTTDCQVYYGVGSGGIAPTDTSNSAVTETAGIFIWYAGAMAETFYYSSNGGGSESVENVWGSTKHPYLVGVVDPYEVTISSSISNYSWNVSYTADELTKILQAKGYCIGTAVTNFQVSSYSGTGNAIEIKFTYANGKTQTFTRETYIRNMLGLRSMRYAVSGGTASGYYINCSGASLPSLSGVCAISGKGKISTISATAPYAITGAGSTAAIAAATSSNSFSITGSGYGHLVGLSQWGANAMARLGYSYTDILKNYFTGVTIGKTG